MSRLEKVRNIDKRILNLVQKHEDWRNKQCLNLIASENVLSPMVKSLLSSDMGGRYTARDRFYRGTKYMDEIQKLGEDLAGSGPGPTLPSGLLTRARLYRISSGILRFIKKEMKFPGDWRKQILLLRVRSA